MKTETHVALFSLGPQRRHRVEWCAPRQGNHWTQGEGGWDHGGSDPEADGWCHPEADRSSSKRGPAGQEDRRHVAGRTRRTGGLRGWGCPRAIPVQLKSKC